MTPAPTRRFTLERHPGAYETWPPRSRLYADGRPTATRVPGYTLLHQFEVEGGYLLVTDHDCPHEEATAFILLDRGLRARSVRQLGAMYATFLLTGLRWIGRTRLVASFGDDHHVRVTIRPWGIPFLRPRLSVRRIRTAPAPPPE